MSVTDQRPTLLTPRKALMQLLGFAVGAALLAWCIVRAAQAGDWSSLRSADPTLVAGLMGCTVVSLAANGTTFWLVIRPVRRLRLVDLQLVNLVTSVLNYTPIRAGLIARIAYHLRVDRLPLIVLGAWLAAIGYTMALTLLAALTATLMRQYHGWSWWTWAAVFIGLLIAGGVLTIALIDLAQVVLKPGFLERVGKGMHRMLRQPAALWGAIALRVVDIAAFSGRMACAAAILDIGLSASQVTLLAITALAASLFPLGRVGYREAAVAFFAQFIGMSGDEFEAKRVQLALVESAGEAAVCIPLGALALLWYRHRWQAPQSSTAPA